jgi:hypothetical protein
MNIPPLYHTCGPPTLLRSYIVFRSLLEEATEPSLASVSSSHDKLNGMKGLKRRVEYEEMTGRIDVPNETFKIVAQSLTFRIEGSARC